MSGDLIYRLQNNLGGNYNDGLPATRRSISKMYYDLDVRVPLSERRAALRTLERLGYDVIAFTTTIQGQKKFNESDLPPARSQGYDDVDNTADRRQTNVCLFFLKVI